MNTKLEKALLEKIGSDKKALSLFNEVKNNLTLNEEEKGNFLVDFFCLNKELDEMLATKPVKKVKKSTKKPLIENVEIDRGLKFFVFNILDNKIMAGKTNIDDAIDFKDSVSSSIEAGDAYKKQFKVLDVKSLQDKYGIDAYDSTNWSGPQRVSSLKEADYDYAGEEVQHQDKQDLEAHVKLTKDIADKITTIAAKLEKEEGELKGSKSATHLEFLKLLKIHELELGEHLEGQKEETLLQLNQELANFIKIYNIYEQPSIDKVKQESVIANKKSLKEAVQQYDGNEYKDIVEKKLRRRIIFDGYDVNNRPIYIADSEKESDEDLEWTIDEKGNIWKHDGVIDKIVAVIQNKIKTENTMNESKENKGTGDYSFQAGKDLFQVNSFDYEKGKQLAVGIMAKFRDEFQSALDAAGLGDTPIAITIETTTLSIASKAEDTEVEDEVEPKEDKKKKDEKEPKGKEEKEEKEDGEKPKFGTPEYFASLKNKKKDKKKEDKEEPKEEEEINEYRELHPTTAGGVQSTIKSDHSDDDDEVTEESVVSSVNDYGYSLLEAVKKVKKSFKGKSFKAFTETVAKDVVTQSIKTEYGKKLGNKITEGIYKSTLASFLTKK